LNFISNQSDVVNIDFKSPIVTPGPVPGVETPGVPGTGHDTIFEMPRGQRRAHVGTHVIDRAVFSVVIKYRNHLIVVLKRPPFPVGNVTNSGDGNKIWHRFGFRYLESNVYNF
jgi:hypothetical protein